jgi:hypothetical protein
MSISISHKEIVIETFMTYFLYEIRILNTWEYVIYILEIFYNFDVCS